MIEKSRPGDAFRDLLASGLDQKLQDCEPERALNALERAYAMAVKATSANSLLRAYRQIAAYRLAHLTLQLATSARAPATEPAMLRRALELFEDAEGGKTATLGPMPLIMQLPVLKRLRDLEGDEARRVGLDQRIQMTLRRAAQMARDYAQPGKGTDDEAKHLSLRSVRENAFLPIAQGPVVNLLELAVYFLAADYSALRGLRDAAGDPCEGLLLGRSFVVVGDPSHEERQSLRLPEAKAREVLQKAAKSGEYNLVFELPARGAPVILHAGQDAKLDPHFDTFHLIALLAVGKTPPAAESLRKLLSWLKDPKDTPRNLESATSQTVSQARQALAKTLAPELAAAGIKTIEGMPKTGLWLNPLIRVLASVDATLLAARHRYR
jgi:hypothetical protein